MKQIALMLVCLHMLACSPQKKPYKLISVRIETDTAGEQTVYTNTENLMAVNDSDAYVQGFTLYHLAWSGKKIVHNDIGLVRWFKVVNDQHDSIAYQMRPSQQKRIIRSIANFKARRGDRTK